MLMRMAVASRFLSFVLALAVVWPCPCDDGEAADGTTEASEQQAHGCCSSPYATADDDGSEDGHDESMCPHCGDDDFVRTAELAVADAIAPASTPAPGALLGTRSAEAVPFRLDGFFVPPIRPPPERWRPDRGRTFLSLGVIRC